MLLFIIILPPRSVAPPMNTLFPTESPPIIVTAPPLDTEVASVMSSTIKVPRTSTFLPLTGIPPKPIEPPASPISTPWFSILLIFNLDPDEFISFNLDEDIFLLITKKK